MTKPVLSFSEKLESLEQRKKELLDKRRAEILNIIIASGAMTIDDRLLAATLVFLADEKNKNHPIKDEIIATLSKKKPVANKQTKSNK